ncbi:hypothetical protein [Sphingomonas sp. M1-B02]|uniref:hypothetical protein n=1 Tax=Sphingomonas sp. M1-B02 TaxID=3114300 RepID=UPI00223EC987|nr:hypothetical protein [Sphingomonas sp. S6-11]UZK66202.1 hypothetical protein OKW87_17125 [Sphingomonas sp. S6-11]
MKLIALAAALAAFGGTAVAQDMPQTTPPTQDMQTTTTAPDTTTTAPDTTTTTPDTTTTTPDTSTTPATTPDMAMPGAPAAAPGAPNTTVVFQPGNATPPPPAQESYPVCSRTVRDQCRNPGGR